LQIVIPRKRVYYALLQSLPKQEPTRNIFNTKCIKIYNNKQLVDKMY
jgi:hypothetical protein